MEFRILQLADRDAILQYERAKLVDVQPDEFEREMMEWHAPWRGEALDHYLPLGWSFGLFGAGDGAGGPGRRLIGYFLAQPQVFTRGLTQSLWVEWVGFDSLDVLGSLLEVAYKLCREKHFQQLLVAKSPILVGKTSALQEAFSVATIASGSAAELLAKFESVSVDAYGIKTAKF